MFMKLSDRFSTSNPITKKVTIMKKLIAVATISFSAIMASAANVLATPAALAVEAEQIHQTTGVVKKVDLEKARVTLAHEAVPSLGWPGMTMGFSVEDQALLKSLEPGQSVQFDFIEGEGGMFVVTDISTR